MTYHPGTKELADSVVNRRPCSLLFITAMNINATDRRVCSHSAYILRLQQASALLSECHGRCVSRSLSLSLHGYYLWTWEWMQAHRIALCTRNIGNMQNSIINGMNDLRRYTPKNLVNGNKEKRERERDRERDTHTEVEIYKRKTNIRDHLRQQ